MAQKGSKRKVFETDQKNPDYGKSFETRMADYRWLKAQADLAENLVKAARLQLYRR